MSSWVRYRTGDGSAGFGVLDGAQIAEYQGDMFGSPQPTGATLACAEITLRSPCAPSKVIALWNNFHALAEKLGKQAPTHPLYLIKPASSVIGHDEPIRRPAAYRGKIAFEGELGIVDRPAAAAMPVLPMRPTRFLAILVHLFGFGVMGDEDDLDVAVLGADELVEQEEKAARQVLLHGVHRARGVHDADHHRVGLLRASSVTRWR